MRSTPGEPRSLALGTAEAIRCPEDGLPLVRSWVGEIEVQRCSGCHGLWLDLDALRAARSVTSDEPCADALGGELIADSAAGKRLLAKLWEWIGEWDDDGPDVD